MWVIRPPELQRGPNFEMGPCLSEVEYILHFKSVSPTAINFIRIFYATTSTMMSKTHKMLYFSEPPGPCFDLKPVSDQLSASGQAIMPPTMQFFR